MCIPRAYLCVHARCFREVERNTSVCIPQAYLCVHPKCFSEVERSSRVFTSVCIPQSSPPFFLYACVLLCASLLYLSPSVSVRELSSDFPIFVTLSPSVFPPELSSVGHPSVCLPPDPFSFCDAP